MKVLIITEDPTLDRYVVQPIVEGIFHDLRQSARVEVLVDPYLRGIDEALDSDTIGQIIDDNAMVDLFLLVVDRDCNQVRNETRASARQQEHPGRLIACVAREEVEVWMLALHRATLGVPWNEIRTDCHPKEKYAEPFLRRSGWATDVGHGRKRAMRDLGRKWRGLLVVCSELKELLERVRSAT